MLARCPAGEQKDGAIDAANDEQKGDARQQQGQRAPCVLLKRRDNRLQLQVKLLRVALRKLLRELPDNSAQFNIGRGGADVWFQFDPWGVGPLNGRVRAVVQQA